MPTKKNKRPAKKVLVNKSSNRQKLLMLVFALVVASVGAYLAFFANAAIPNGKLVYSVFNDGTYAVNGDGSDRVRLDGGSTDRYTLERHPSAQFATYATTGLDSKGAYYYERANVINTDNLTKHTFYQGKSCEQGAAQHEILGSMAFRTSISNNLPRLLYTLAKTPCGTPENIVSDSLIATNADGSQKTKLVEVSGGQTINHPQWSVDSSKIYYTLCQNQYNLDCNLVVRTGGASPSTRTLVTGIYPEFSLSGDGKKIAYQIGVSNVQRPVYIANSDGSSKKAILTPSTTNPIRISKNSLCRLGTKILYQNTPDVNSPFTNELRTISTDGKSVKQLLSRTTSSENPRSYQQFAWSPNCDSVVYGLNDQSGYNVSIKTVRSDGSNLKTVVSNPSERSGFTW